jgi:glycerol-3-phosphate dehydrogenase (NAD(P)+)
MRTTVIGGGAWGTALATVLRQRGHDVLVWAHDADVVESIEAVRENTRYLPGVRLPDGLHATGELGAAVARAELVLAVSPSHVTREVMVRAAPSLPPSIPIVCATKGIENDTLMTMSEVLEDVLPPERHPYLAFLSGPSFAAEVVRGLPTAVVVAARWERLAKQVQQVFALPAFRVYSSPDVVGTELGGALKNVIAIAAGASDGLGFGHNARSGLITRGLAEITRLAVRRGAHPMTLSGLAGLGDLVLTCTAELSRNRTVGFRLGRGESIDAILASMRQVAEGVKTTQAAHDLAHKVGVDMPLTDAVYSVLYEGVTARDAVASILGRELKPEFS